MSDKARDNLIKSRLFERDESGLRELEKAYSPLCADIARGVLSDSRDVEECVNERSLPYGTPYRPPIPKVYPHSFAVSHGVSLSRNSATTRVKCATAEGMPCSPRARTY